MMAKRKSNKQVKAMIESIDCGQGRKWVKVDHEEFHSKFNIKEAELFSSYTNCSDDYARSVFSMNGKFPTHKTIHCHGLKNWPDFYVNR